MGAATAGAQLDKKDHPHIVLPVLADDDRFLDLLQAFHLPVDFRRADTIFLAPYQASPHFPIYVVQPASRPKIG